MVLIVFALLGVMIIQLLELKFTTTLSAQTHGPTIVTCHGVVLMTLLVESSLRRMETDGCMSIRETQMVLSSTGT